MKLKLLQETLLLRILLHYQIRKTLKMTKGTLSETDRELLIFLLTITPRMAHTLVFWIVLDLAIF